MFIDEIDAVAKGAHLMRGGALSRVESGMSRAWVQMGCSVQFSVLCCCMFQCEQYALWRASVQDSILTWQPGCIYLAVRIWKPLSGCMLPRACICGRAQTVLCKSKLPSFKSDGS